MVMFTNLANELGPHPVGLVLAPRPNRHGCQVPLSKRQRRRQKILEARGELPHHVSWPEFRCHELLGTSHEDITTGMFSLSGWWFQRLFMFFISYTVWDVILLIDELIFFRGVGQPPTRQCVYILYIYILSQFSMDIPTNFVFLLVIFILEKPLFRW